MFEGCRIREFESVESVSINKMGGNLPVLTGPVTSGSEKASPLSTSGGYRIEMCASRCAYVFGCVIVGPPAKTRRRESMTAEFVRLSVKPEIRSAQRSPLKPTPIKTVAR